MDMPCPRQQQRRPQQQHSKSRSSNSNSSERENSCSGSIGEGSIAAATGKSRTRRTEGGCSYTLDSTKIWFNSSVVRELTLRVKMRSTKRCESSPGVVAVVE